VLSCKDYAQAFFVCLTPFFCGERPFPESLRSGTFIWFTKTAKCVLRAQVSRDEEVLSRISVVRLCYLEGRRKTLIQKFSSFFLRLNKKK